ncbi:MAG TPA: hypothetical protein EYH31_07070, partial [Anaerolineae bacterium]|nr:hypothetical protein [Anaerolineae bacterium]
YDLVVVGKRGVRGISRLLRSTSNQITRQAPVSVLVVPKVRTKIERILICTSGAPAGEDDAWFGGHIAALTGAQATVLHVMSQLPLTPQAFSRDLEATAREAIAMGTREGKHLQRGVEILTSLGVQGRPVLRHGLVVEEILAEAQEGDYDLVVLGAHNNENQKNRGWAAFLLDDVTQHILNEIDRPVLVVRHPKHEIQWQGPE